MCYVLFYTRTYIKVTPVENYFFDVSDASFEDSSFLTSGEKYTDASVSEFKGLNLSLSASEDENRSSLEYPTINRITKANTFIKKEKLVESFIKNHVRN